MELQVQALSSKISRPIITNPRLWISKPASLAYIIARHSHMIQHLLTFDFASILLTPCQPREKMIDRLLKSSSEEFGKGSLPFKFTWLWTTNTWTTHPISTSSPHQPHLHELHSIYLQLPKKVTHPRKAKLHFLPSPPKPKFASFRSRSLRSETLQPDP